MKNSLYATALGMSLLLLGDRSFAATLYDLDFTPPEVGAYSIWNGTPTVVPSFGGMADAMLFHAKPDFGSDGIQLALGVHPAAYTIDFDVVTHGLRDSLYAFTVYLEGDSSGSVSLHGGLDAFHIYQPSPYTLSEPQAFADDVPYHVSLLADLVHHTWQVSVDGVPVYANALNTPDIEDVTFALRDWRLGAAEAPNVLVALDNIHIETVPEPGGASLLLLACLGWAGRRLALRAH